MTKMVVVLADLPFRKALAAVNQSRRRTRYYLAMRDPWDDADLDKDGLPLGKKITERVGVDYTNFSQVFGRGLATRSDPLIAYRTTLGRTPYRPKPWGVERLIMEAQEWTLEPILLGWRQESVRRELDRFEIAFCYLRCLARWAVEYPGLAPYETSLRELPDAALQSIESLKANTKLLVALSKQTITSRQASVDSSVADVRAALSNSNSGLTTPVTPDTTLAAFGKLFRELRGDSNYSQPMIRDLLRAALDLLEKDSCDAEEEE